MIPGAFQTLRYWSVSHGQRVERVSMVDEHGAEHWMLLTERADQDEGYRRFSGSERRIRCAVALDLLEDHIYEGSDAGEVCPDPGDWALRVADAMKEEAA